MEVIVAKSFFIKFLPFGKSENTYDEKHLKEHSAILSDLAKTKSDLDAAYSNFENVIEPDLIDSCIYELNAVQKKYKFLLERVRSIEVSSKL